MCVVCDFPGNQTRQGINLEGGVEREGGGEFGSGEDPTADLAPGFADACC